jgi:hypothetical protein
MSRAYGAGTVVAVTLRLVDDLSGELLVYPSDLWQVVLWLYYALALEPMTIISFMVIMIIWSVWFLSSVTRNLTYGPGY